MDHQIQILRAALASEQHKSSHVLSVAAGLGILAGAGIIAAADEHDPDSDASNARRIRVLPATIGACCIVAAIAGLVAG